MNVSFDKVRPYLLIQKSRPQFLASSIRVNEASFGTNFHIILGIAGGAALLLIVIAIVLVKKNQTRPPTKIVVDKVGILGDSVIFCGLRCPFCVFLYDVFEEIGPL